MSYPNQLFTFSQRQKCEKDFLQISNKAWINAQKNLTSAAFAMWLWLIGNSSSYRNELSRAAFINEFGYSEKTYEKAWRELKQKGYAVLKEFSKNTYLILEEPIKKNNPLPAWGDNDGENIPLLEEGVSPSHSREHPLPQEGVSPSQNTVEIDKHINIYQHIPNVAHSPATQGNEQRRTEGSQKEEEIIELPLAEIHKIIEENYGAAKRRTDGITYEIKGKVYRAI